MKKYVDRWWNIPAALLLLAAITTAASRLSTTEWTENLDMVVVLAIFGAILGLGLGYSRFKGWLVGIFCIVYTLFFVPWQLGLTLGEDIAWLERLESLGGRLWASLAMIFQNQPLTDPLLFLTNMALLFWALGLTAGYGLTRSARPWQPLVIAGVAIMIVDFYNPPIARGGIYLAFFIIFALLLLTQLNYIKSAKQWEDQKITIESDFAINVGRGSLVAVLALVIIAWNATTAIKSFYPDTPEQEQLVRAWRGIQRWFENAVAPLRGPLIIPLEVYGDEFTLGTGSALGDQVIFTVDSNSSAPPGQAFYWRARSYDKYEGGHWISTIEQKATLTDEDWESEFTEVRGTARYRFTIQTEKNLGMLYAPAVTTRVSRPVTMIFDQELKVGVDIITLLAEPMIRTGESYRVEAMINTPTIVELRAAGTDYPDWITQRYLQLPEDFPDSIRTLAAEITAGMETPYDKAMAITYYLRDNIEYAPVIDTPPAGRDPIEWFLFDYKRGFCNYYATAEILMLRSLGVPARWTAGYAQGEYEIEQTIYSVRQKDSHAWPEVYFPEIGWIEFEPTASQPLLDRPSGINLNQSNRPQFGTDPLQRLEEDLESEESPSSQPTEEPAPPEETEPFLKKWLFLMILGGIALAIIITSIFLIRASYRNPEKSVPVLIEKSLLARGLKPPALLRLWTNMVRLTPIERVFYHIEWLNRFMGYKEEKLLTPTEQVNVLTNIFPESKEAAEILLDEYQKEIYSPHPADIDRAREARKTLWQLAIRQRTKALVDYVLAGKPMKTS